MLSNNIICNYFCAYDDLKHTIFISNDTLNKYPNSKLYGMAHNSYNFEKYNDALIIKDFTKEIFLTAIECMMNDFDIHIIHKYLYNIEQYYNWYQIGSIYGKHYMRMHDVYCTNKLFELKAFLKSYSLTTWFHMIRFDINNCVNINKKLYDMMSYNKRIKILDHDYGFYIIIDNVKYNIQKDIDKLNNLQFEFNIDKITLYNQLHLQNYTSEFVNYDRFVNIKKINDILDKSNLFTSNNTVTQFEYIDTYDKKIKVDICDSYTMNDTDIIRLKK